MKETTYSAANKQRDKRLKQWTNVESGSLAGELQVARLLLDEALRSDKPGLCDQLIATITRLVKNQTEIEKARGDLISRADAMLLGQQIVEVVIRALRSRFPEEIVNSIVDEIYSDMVPRLSHG
jgi:hypothetical protein